MVHHCQTGHKEVTFFPTSLQRKHYQSHYKYAAYQIFLRMYTLYLIVYDTGWFMTCAHYCRRWFPRSLLSGVNISKGHILSSYGVTGSLSPTPSREQCIASYSTWPWTSRYRNSQQKLQLATGTVHNWVAAWVVARSGNFINLLQAQIVVNWRQFYEVKITLQIYWVYVLFTILFDLFSVILNLYSKFLGSCLLQ